jgi:hypothetical protein
VLSSDWRCHALYFERSAESSFLAAREKVRAFEAGIAARLTKGEQRELRGCWASCRRRAANVIEVEQLARHLRAQRRSTDCGASRPGLGTPAHAGLHGG